MHEYNIFFTTKDKEVLKILEIINDKLDEIKSDKDTLLDALDIDGNDVDGFINIGREDAEFNEDDIISTVENTLKELKVDFKRHTIPSVDTEEYYYPIFMTIG